MFENRKYVIVPADKINDVNFTEVLETAPNTCRYSVDATKTFVKYDGEMPASIAAIAGISQEYTHAEILAIIATSDWTVPSEEM